MPLDNRAGGPLTPPVGCTGGTTVEPDIERVTFMTVTHHRAETASQQGAGGRAWNEGQGNQAHTFESLSSWRHTGHASSQAKDCGNACDVPALDTQGPMVFLGAGPLGTLCLLCTKIPDN